MSQGGLTRVTQGSLPPQVPLTFTTNNGIATATFNNINLTTQNTTVEFVGGGNNIVQDFGLTNLIIGTEPVPSASGQSNVGLGTSCLSLLFNGQRNSALGHGSMNALVNSLDCTAVGYQSMVNAPTGNNNTAVGANSLQSVQTSNNSALGQGCLANLVSGGNCCGVGTLVMANNISSSFNNAMGYTALANLTSGAGRNTAIGDVAGVSLVNGEFNTLISFNAGLNYTGSESSNICISSNGVVGDNNTVRIGSQGTGAGLQNLCYIAGITGSTVVGAAVLCDGTGKLGTIVSSERYKDDIQDMVSSISVLNLRPVEFTYKQDASKTTQFGLIAEEVHEEFPYLCLYDKEGRPDSVKYHELPVFLLKEIQRLNKRIEALERKSA